MKAETTFAVGFSPGRCPGEEEWQVFSQLWEPHRAHSDHLFPLVDKSAAGTEGRDSFVWLKDQYFQGQMLAAVVELLPGMPASHVGIPGFECEFDF